MAMKSYHNVEEYFLLLTL